MDEIERAVEKTLREVEESRDFTTTAKRMVFLHSTKPWVPGFKAVAISPNRERLESYLGARLFRAFERDWYYPSLVWWKAHSASSHPPAGRGCSVEIHSKFLSADQEAPEFLYANVLLDGGVKVLGDDDFKEECAVWDDVFRQA